LERKYTGSGKLTAKGLKWLYLNNKITRPYDLDVDMLNRLTVSGKIFLKRI
jgi:hypothetical protein